MLTRNCEKRVPLIFPGDFNVRVTVCTPKSRYLTSSVYYPTWIETIKDAVGGSIIHSSEVKAFVIRRIDKDGDYLFRERGDKLIEKLIKVFQKPVSFRLETIEEHPKAWVFFLLQDI